MLVTLPILAVRFEARVDQSLSELHHDVRTRSDIEHGVAVVGRTHGFDLAFPAPQLNHLSADQAPAARHATCHSDDPVP